MLLPRRSEKAFQNQKAMVPGGGLRKNIRCFGRIVNKESDGKYPHGKYHLATNFLIDLLSQSNKFKLFGVITGKTNQKSLTTEEVRKNLW